MNRRGFMGAILAACAAPAIVRADSLMRIVAEDSLVFVPGYGVIAKADASWVGAVRELRAYNIHRDEYTWRWDVIARPMTGGFEQYTVTMPADTRRDQAIRDAGLAMLREHIESRKWQPIRGVLQLPDGLEHARLL